jgi:hypothetical protein
MRNAASSYGGREPDTKQTSDAIPMQILGAVRAYGFGQKTSYPCTLVRKGKLDFL